MAKQGLENCSVLSYLKKAHNIHVINPRVSGMKVQKYLENFRRKTVPLPPCNFFPFFFSKKNFSGKLPHAFKKRERKIFLPFSHQTF